MVRRGLAGRGTAWPGKAGHGRVLLHKQIVFLARRDLAGRGESRLGSARRGTAGF